MPFVQTTVQGLRRIAPRGWSPVLSGLARLCGPLQRYKAKLDNADHIYLDLREYMCHIYLYNGRLPHEEGTERLLPAILTEGATFVDVGANLGYFTRIASRLVGPSGSVIAVEPAPAAYRLLRLNSADLENVTVVNKALAEKQGTANFYVRKKGDMSSLSEDSSADAIVVEISTLDRVLAGCRKVDLIKIDVEGFELGVIKGGLETIKKHRPIIYFEFIEEFAERLGFAFADFASVLVPLGYRLSWINNARNDDRILGEEATTYAVAIPDGISL